MYRSTISTPDAAAVGKRPVPADLLGRIERADELLKAELGDVKARFPIEVRWQVAARPGSDAHDLTMDLTARGAGITDYPLDASRFQTDDSILQQLRGPLWSFGKVLDNLLKSDLDRLRRDIDALAALVGA